MKIILDGVPPSWNRFAGRKNCWEYRETKAVWTNKVAWMAKAAKPKQPYKRALVRICYRFPDSRRRDPDNYSGKPLLDGLTKGGVIADDSFRCIKLMIEAEETPGKPQTTIEVEEI